MSFFKRTSMSHSDTLSEAEQTSQALKGQVDNLQKFNKNIKEKISYIELLKEKCNKKEQSIAEKESNVEKMKKVVYDSMKDFSSSLPMRKNDIDQEFESLNNEFKELNKHGYQLTQQEEQIENELNKIKSYLRQFGGEIGSIRNSIIALDENDPFLDSIDFSTIDLKQAYNLICDISTEISEHEKIVIGADMDLIRMRVQHMKILESVAQLNVEISNEKSKHYLYRNDNNSKRKQVDEFSKSAQSLKSLLEKEVTSLSDTNKPIQDKLQNTEDLLKELKTKIETVVGKQEKTQNLISSYQNEAEDFNIKKAQREKESKKEIEAIILKFRQLQNKKNNFHHQTEEVQQYIKSLDEIIQKNNKKLQLYEEKVLQEERDVRILEISLKKEEAINRKQAENKAIQMSNLIDEFNRLLEERTCKLTELDELEHAKQKPTVQVSIPEPTNDNFKLEKLDSIVRKSLLIKEQINVAMQKIIQLRSLRRATKGEIKRIQSIITSDQQTHFENQNNSARALSNIASHHELEMSRLKRSILILTLQNDERRSSISKKQDVLEKISTEYDIAELPNGTISVSRKPRSKYISSYSADNFIKIIDHLNCFYKDVAHALSKLQIATVSSVQKSVINKWSENLSKYDDIKLPIIG